MNLRVSRHSPSRASADEPSGGGWRAAYTLMELLVVVTIIAILLGLIMPAIQAAREAARSTQCSSNLKQMALAVHAYHSIHNRFPTGSTMSASQGGVGNSWHVYSVAHLEEQAIADRILNHGERIAPPIPVFFCPSDGGREGLGSAPWNALHKSNYAGSGGAKRGVMTGLCGPVYTDGVFYPLSKTAAKTITDGLSYTLAIGERTYDLRIWTDGAFWIDDRGSTAFCLETTKNVSRPVNWPEAVPALNDRQFGSRHPGGAWFAFAGGNVHFIADDIDFTLLQDLATRDGGEVVKWPD
jgi:prepilin-type N-terminal cleavage/methylation domain-containing protein